MEHPISALDQWLFLLVFQKIGRAEVSILYKDQKRCGGEEISEGSSRDVVDAGVSISIGFFSTSRIKMVCYWHHL